MGVGRVQKVQGCSGVQKFRAFTTFRGGCERPEENTRVCRARYHRERRRVSQDSARHQGELYSSVCGTAIRESALQPAGRNNPVDAHPTGRVT
jgi:hypothetical protein